MLKENEVLDDLLIENRKIIQNTTKYKFTSDSVLLANFAKVKKGQIVVDLCSGSGIIGILAAIKYQPQKVFLVEIQEYMADMSKRSCELNNLDNIEVKNIPCKESIESIGVGVADYVLVNPPYKKVSKDLINKSSEIAISRHEIKTNLSEVIEVASKLLKFGGKISMVHSAERVAEIIIEMSKYNLAVKEICFTQGSDNTEANSVLITASKGGKNGVKVLPVLVTNNTDGTYKHYLKKYIN